MCKIKGRRLDLGLDFGSDLVSKSIDGKGYSLVSTLLQLNARAGNKVVRRCGELKGGLCDR